MKKVLLGTSALVLSAGVAFADGHAGGVAVGGSAELWVEEVGGADASFNNEIELTFSASGETDGGLGFGADFAFVDGATDNNEVYISGSWGKLTVGDTDDALQKVASLGDIGFDGLGVDDLAEVGRGDGDSDGVLYENNLGPATIYLAMNQDTGVDDMSAGVKFSAGAITVGIGYEDQGGADLTAFDVSGDLGGIGFDVYYEDGDANDTNYGTIISYDAGAATINFGYADGDANTGDAAMGIGFSMDLGGGASLSGGVVDDGQDNTNWDLGIGMSF